MGKYVLHVVRGGNCGNNPGRNRLLLLMSMLLAFVAMTGCVKPEQYRTKHDPCIVTPAGKGCENSVQEIHDEYVLNFVEFDDQGALWDREQLKSLLTTLGSKEYVKSGAIIIVFVHGWEHNAFSGDANVLQFRDLLRRISRFEEQTAKETPRRKVVGVYAGWRGRSLGSFASYFTFWDRKNVADTVGHGSVTELLLQLENIERLHHDSQPNNTRLVLIGHSFGGQIVYSALSQIFLDRFVDLKGEDADTYGDLVVLVNPAFEASRYTPLLAASKDRTYLPGQLPLITIFGAKNDQATGLAFPIGRYLSTLFVDHRSNEQEEADTQAIGHYEPYITHSLTWKHGAKKTAEPAVTPEKVASPLDVENADKAATRKDLTVLPKVTNQWQEISSKDGWTREFGEVKLSHLKKLDPRNPFYVVSVDSEIIDGHSGIWKPDFADFLRQFIIFSAGDSNTRNDITENRGNNASKEGGM